MDDDFDRRLKWADEEWNVMVLGQTVMDLLRENPSLNFADIERHLRRLDCITYLLAAPATLAPPGIKIRWINGSEQPYWNWMELNGPKERAKKMKEFGIPNDAENLLRLTRCGFLSKN